MPFEADKWQIKHDKTSIQLQIFPNRRAIRAQMLWRNVETVETRVALPGLVGKARVQSFLVLHRSVAAFQSVLGFPGVRFGTHFLGC